MKNTCCLVKILIGFDAVPGTPHQHVGELPAVLNVQSEKPLN